MKPTSLHRIILSCTISSCLRYRYQLYVEINPHSAAHLTVLLKNPSTADASRGDPTTGKVEAWARQHGFSTVTYLNLFALRSPYPKTLNQHSYLDVVGPENDRVLVEALKSGSLDGGRWTIDDLLPSTVHRPSSVLLVLAWGNPNGIDPARYQRRIHEVLGLIESAGVAVHTVGELTKLGYPRHGLQWRVGMGYAQQQYHK